MMQNVCPFHDIIIMLHMLSQNFSFMNIYMGLYGIGLC